MASSRDRQSALLYPFPLTHVIGLLYFVSSGVVAGILCYFIYYLRQDSMSVPLQLIFPLVTSLLALLLIVSTFYIHTFRVSSARQNLVFSVVIFALWSASMAMIFWKLNHMVLSRSCSIEMWRTDMGMMVCRIYKAMASFLIISWLLSAASFMVDLRVVAAQGSRGAYAQMKDDSRLQKGTYVEMKAGMDDGTPNIGGDRTPKI